MNRMGAPRMILIRGKGGNAKSMLSALRANVAGENHAFVSETVFDKKGEYEIEKKKPKGKYRQIKREQ